ncbi:serine/threonine protein kinase [Dehalococcoides mccartyi]|uniref:serine/threonine-protein kinase n=1 Tax=Dehalococcoides mccartyi TaxID=61435 RepID=UPI000CDE8E6F|nr:serine/threonine-protein kinase [Dehalococcoides mccartyi]POZ58431.1 serine/threonine protein kinase [Dehalococcoides mccartyi]
MLFEEGRAINNVYEVDRFLGEGAFAEVYRVKHKYLGRQAMKVFKAPSTSVKEVEDKLSEAMILSRIGHSNIIRVFDAGTAKVNGQQYGYFTMEYVAGGSLDTYWRSYRSEFVPISEVVEIITQVCMGLSVAHAERPPIIHRDIKPQNILVGYDTNGLRIRIADFGLAKNVNPLTLLASAKGTPAFKPPESLSNVDSCAADVWGIGVTFYLLLTDHLPFPVDNRMDFQKGRWWKNPLVPASRFNPQVDSTLDSILSRSLEIKPSDRYTDASAMLGDISKWKHTGTLSPAKSGENADERKSALGLDAQPSEISAGDMVANALNISRQPGQLNEAADLLEEALNKSPGLKEKYEYQLRLWRRGMVI